VLFGTSTGYCRSRTTALVDKSASYLSSNTWFIWLTLHKIGSFLRIN